ncbi:Uncharacterized protein containing a von Willebrand factor type A (vWA) domain-like protein [Haliangium ochraceum DSM 14365]|uniref:Uncharacterized protein containing a von Willebrand factor type A (VWA) domain-like protein n=1 Tax=Haliangium ochraceum (strain DSM 14365 / JCM 11303 / SMP-2) TaxID=502025 RepID=D0LUP3_HALO1|nr:Uncharacterized protein containing a von Willebrand factor type A (vWA) domain-like protein [Haliangium ochraceum DSM 14365]
MGALTRITKGALSWRASARLSEPKPGAQCVVLSRYDRWHFERLGAHDQALMQRLQRTPALVPVAFDLYGFLYKPRPQRVPGAALTLAVKVLAKLAELGELAAIRQRTVLSEWATVMHLNALLGPVEEFLQRGGGQSGAGGHGDANAEGAGGAGGGDAEVLEAFERAHGLGQQPARASQPGRSQPEQSDEHSDEQTGEHLAPGKHGLADTSSETDARDADLRAALQQACAELAEALRAVDEVAEAMQECDTWGREPGDFGRLPIEEFQRLSQVLRETPSVRKIVELAGRWSELLKPRLKRGHSPRGRSELVGVTLGGGLERLCATELIKLRHPALRRVLLGQLAERRALVHELRGPDVLGRGPMILVVDTSGSMHGARMTMAKSLMLALALHCWEQRRPLRVLTFGAPGEMHESEVAVDEPFWTRLEQCLSVAFGGGTDFDGPLLRVCEIVGERPWRRADAVFLTDGECCVAEATRAQLARTRARVALNIIGVLVGRGRGLDGVADIAYRARDGRGWRGDVDPRTWEVLERDIVVDV